MSGTFKNNLLLYITSLSFFFYLSANVLVGNDVWPFRTNKQKSIDLSELFSADSLNSLYHNEEFKTAVISFIQSTADTSRTLAQHTDVDAFRRLGDDIEARLLQLRTIEPPKPSNVRRGLFDGLIGKANGGGGGNGQAGGAGGDGGGLLGKLGSLLGGAGGGAGGGLAGLLSEGLNKIVGALDMPAFFLGVGLGMGTATGLNLTSESEAKAQATKVAAANNLQPSGINGVAMNLGSGLTSVIVPAVPLGGLTGQIAPAAFSLAQGIGNATASGLQLTQKQFGPTNGSGLADIAGNFGLGITTPIVRSINVTQLLNQATAQGGMINIADTAAAAGRGLGEGAVEGLNFGKPQQPPTPGVARRQQSLAANTTASTVNAPQIAQGFTKGLASSFLKEANLGALVSAAGVNTQGAQQMIMQQLPQAISRAGKGLGEGAAQGLGIVSAAKAAELQNPTVQTGGTNVDIPGIAEDFTKTLSSSFLGSADINALTANIGGQGQQLMAQLPAIIEGAGKGLGEGAATGLGISNNAAPGANTPTGNMSLAMARIQAPAANPQDPAVIAESFTRSLSSSFLGNANLSGLTSRLSATGNGLLGNMDLNQMLAPAAFGLYRGLGEGAAIGIGLQPDSGVPTSNAPNNGMLDIGLVTRAFGKGLSQDFLANGTVTKLADSLKQQAPVVNVPKVAEGFARGLVDGAMMGISDAGGLSNVISGNVPVQKMLSSPTDMGGTQFNDSVNGAATALGRGFGSEGVILVSMLISNKGLPKQNTTVQKRNTKVKGIARRQDTNANTNANANTDNTGVTPIVNGTFLSMGAQLGIDAIGCTGVGGLVSIGLGLVQNGRISLSFQGLDNKTKSLLPTDPIILKLAGNRFDVNARDFKVKINGLNLVPFAVLTGVHIVLVVSAFFFWLPLFILLNAMQRISALCGKPVQSVKSERWQKRVFFFAYLPAAIGGTVLGLVAEGDSKHFRSRHGVIGLITLVLTVIGAIVYLLRARNPRPIDSQIFLPIKYLIKSPPKPSLPLAHGIMIATVAQASNFAFLSGWEDLGNVSFCASEALATTTIAIGIGTFCMFLIISAMAVVSLRFWLEQRALAKPVDGGRTIYISSPQKGEFPRESKLAAAAAARQTALLQPPELVDEEKRRVSKLAAVSRVKQLRNALK